MVWQKPIRKTFYTLNINGYDREITEITYPLMKHYCEKIGAKFHVIDQRRFPNAPVTYEKLQIFQLMKDNGDDWAYFMDSDCLIHPDMFDPTNHVGKDKVLHNGVDMAGHRWKYDRYFLRDGRHIGSCNWFAIASDWCVDLWHPLDDISFEEAVANIYPTVNELNTVVDAQHLIDDYTLSRNIAKYGLKVATVMDILKVIGYGPDVGFLWHHYTEPNEQKLVVMKQQLQKWRILK